MLPLSITLLGIGVASIGIYRVLTSKTLLGSEIESLSLKQKAVHGMGTASGRAGGHAIFIDEDYRKPRSIMASDADKIVDQTAKRQGDSKEDR